MNADELLGITVFLVDDNPSNLNVVVSYLNQRGLKPVPLKSGEEALAVIEKRLPDIILLDVQMPGGIDGFETCRRLKANRRSQNIPVIFISAASETVDKVTGFSLGGVDYITKPVDVEELLSRIHVHITIRRLQQELWEANKTLEEKVIARTASLTKANEVLRSEIAERQEAENRLKNSLQEKEVMLKEIHHRVKNNMQIVSSILDLQVDRITEPYYQALFKESQNRIQSMALVHEKLYQSNDLARIDFSQYIHTLVDHIAQSQPEQTVSTELALAPILLNISTAIPCGLIVNELVSNAFKHGFPNGRTGKIKIALQEIDDQQIQLVVADNGVGLPVDMDYKNSPSLGLVLVNTLVNQIKGKIVLNRESGTSFSITFGTS